MSERSVIDSEEAVRLFTQSSPEFQDAYNAQLRNWAPDVPPVTILFGAFGWSLCSHAPQASTLELASTCDLIEQLMSRGTEPVKTAVATSMLEAILAASSAGKFDFRLLAPSLCPLTKAYCQSWDEFTGVRTLGLWDD